MVNKNNNHEQFFEINFFISFFPRLDDDVYSKMYYTKRKRKEKPKSIIREAKLKLPIQLTDKTTQKAKGRKAKGLTSDVTCVCSNYESTDEPLTQQQRYKTQQQRHQQNFNQQNSLTCSTQYNILNHNEQVPSAATAASEVDYNSSYDDDELALYFEQMLYIPKPMSLMAEMMYA